MKRIQQYLIEDWLGKPQYYKEHTTCTRHIDRYINDLFFLEQYFNISEPSTETTLIQDPRSYEYA